MPDTHRYTVAHNGGDPDLLAARLHAAGALGVWIRAEDVVAWFDTPTPDAPGDGTWSVESDRDWQAEWKASIAPVTAGRVVIVPTWLADEHGASPGELRIVLDPGRAFGSGHHATTTQCLELLQDVGAAGHRVLDVGTGTGILAIAAALLDAAEVVAVDLDPDAVAVAGDNAARAGVDLDLRVGSLDAAPGRYDVVLANLVTDTLVVLAPALAAAVEAGGHLIVSGVANERQDRVEGALVRQGLRSVQATHRDGWAALLLRREAP